MGSTTSLSSREPASSYLLILIVLSVVMALAGRAVFSVYVAVKNVRSSNRRGNMISNFFIYLFTDKDPAGYSDHENTIQNGNELPDLT